MEDHANADKTTQYKCNKCFYQLFLEIPWSLLLFFLKSYLKVPYYTKYLNFVTELSRNDESLPLSFAPLFRKRVLQQAVEKTGPL